MQKETVTLTLDLTLDELFHVTCFLRDLRSETGSDPAYYKDSRTIDGVSVPLTVPVAALSAPDYRPPQAPLAAQSQPAPAPSWQPPQAPLAAQPQPVQPQQGLPPQWQQQQQTFTPVPTSAPAFTLEQLSVAAAPLMDAGRGAELTAMLALFGVASLGQIPPERYPDVALNLRAMGAAI